MVYIDNIDITPNPVIVKGQVTIEVTLHEESAGAKKYPYRYPYRYKSKEENK